MSDIYSDNGLIWSSKDNGFLWGWGHGALLWAPHWVKNLIVSTVNPIMCQIYGHKVMGPFEEDGKVIIERCCYMCCSRKV